MVKINKIYTRTGDKGETGLVGGSRIAKDAPQVEAYGEIDELNSHLGDARTAADELCKSAPSDKVAARFREMLAILQNELFDLGSELATPPGTTWPNRVVIEAAQATRLESWIDELTEGIPELRSFVLPGGTRLNAVFHIARAVSRRAERRIISFSKNSPVSPAVLTYVNRLSDLLFAMARAESHRAGTPEYLWNPGKAPGSK